MVLLVFPKKIIESDGSKSLLTHNKNPQETGDQYHLENILTSQELCRDFVTWSLGFESNMFLLPPRKLTWQWKLHHVKMYFLLKMGIFQCHVSFHGCIPCGNDPIWLPCFPGLEPRQITAPLLASSTSPNVPSPRNEALSKGLKKPLVSLKALGGGNSNIFYFHPYLGKIPILTNIFQMGWNHQLDWFPSRPY